MERFAADDGQILHVQVRGKARGTGPAAVLLHGWAADHTAWGPAVAELASRFTLLAWDARGHGRSVPTPGAAPPTLARMAQDFRCLLRHFRLEAPLAAGHSMGALTLWQAVADQGCDGLGSLCLIDQSPRLITGPDWPLGIYGDFPSEANRRFLDGLKADFPETVLRLIAHGLNRRAREQYEANSRGFRKLRQAYAALDPVPLIACWESLAAADLRPALAAIRVPTLLVYGAASNFYLPATAAFVHAAIPGSVLAVFEDADHAPHIGQPDRFAACLTGFRFLQAGAGSLAAT